MSAINSCCCFLKKITVFSESKITVLVFDPQQNKPILLFEHCRLSMFQLAQIVGETFFEYQDVLRDSFLTAKMFVAVGGYDFFADSRNFGTFSTLVRSYLIYKSDILQYNTVG